MNFLVLALLVLSIIRLGFEEKLVQILILSWWFVAVVVCAIHRIIVVDSLSDSPLQS